MSDDTRSADAIEAEIEATRVRLASTVDELATRAQPKEIARRQAEAAKVTLSRQAEVAKVTLSRQGEVAMVKLNEAARTPDGQFRTERLAAVGAALAMLFSLLVFRRVRR
jgi:hypothetical protein